MGILNEECELMDTYNMYICGRGRRNSALMFIDISFLAEQNKYE
jgi:hypothetical protein